MLQRVTINQAMVENLRSLDLYKAKGASLRGGFEISELWMPRARMAKAGQCPDSLPIGVTEVPPV